MQKFLLPEDAPIDTVLDSALGQLNLIVRGKATLLQPLLESAKRLSVMPNNLAMISFAIEENKDIA